jgi:hypothetical protein
VARAVVLSAVRTPVGRYGGRLAGVRPDDLAATVIAEAVARADVPTAEIEDVWLGCANQAGEGNRNVARFAALLAGLPESVAGVTVNRLCASGMSAIVGACHAVIAGDSEGGSPRDRPPRRARSHHRRDREPDRSAGTRQLHPRSAGLRRDGPEPLRIPRNKPHRVDADHRRHARRSTRGELHVNCAGSQDGSWRGWSSGRVGGRRRAPHRLRLIQTAPRPMPSTDSSGGGRFDDRSIASHRCGFVSTLTSAETPMTLGRWRCAPAT